ncbi:MAG: hypothetical protein DME32_18160 [Verrucomicrobia bacterium]|nr:MAG: hypothetical protein DME32_18160 [Verrucomicrobiota bacterium]
MQRQARDVYRIAEEAVGNAVRHAKANKVTIEMHITPGRKIALTITDDGVGFRRAQLKGWDCKT